MNHRQEVGTGENIIPLQSQYISGYAKLRAIGEAVFLHPKIRLKYVGNTPEGEPLALALNDGQMKPVFNKNEGLWDFFIDYKTDAKQFPLQDVFVRGHEEGHFVHYSGNLKLLYRWCQQAGIKFLDEMPLEKVLRSDEITRSFYDGTSEDIAEFYWTWNDSVIVPGTSERIAHLGGLLALHKAGFTKEVKELEKRAREDYLSHFPYFLERFESTRPL